MNWFSRLTVGGRLVAGFVVMVMITAVVGFQGLRGSAQIHAQLKDIYDVHMKSIDYLVEADRDLQQLLVAERSMIFANSKSDEFKQLVKDYEENRTQAWDRWTKYKDLASTPEEQRLLPAFETAWQQWSEVSRRIVDDRTADTREGRREALDLSLGQAATRFEAMRNGSTP